jgi:hypothetical protein
MLYGRSGRVHKFSNQYIETRVLGLLFVYQSFFVTDKKEIEIPLNKVSVSSHYIALSGIFVIFLLIVSIGSGSVFTLPLIVVLGGIMYYSWIYGKPTKIEIKQRTLFQEALGLNALPEWLSLAQRQKYYNQLQPKVDVEHLKTCIENKDYTYEQFCLYYTFIAYYISIYPNDKEAKLLHVKFHKKLVN